MDNQDEQVITSSKLKEINNKRMCKRKYNFFKYSIILSIIMLLLIDQQQIEAKKYKKEKKIIKSLVKGLIFKNLSTKKNILPMPVPIPGKWQQILNTLIETSGKLDSLEHKKFSTKATTTTTKLSSALNGSTMAKNGLTLLLAALDNRYSSSSSSNNKSIFKLNKYLSPSQTSSSTSSSSISPDELANIKKLTRQAAAKYAGRLISNQTPTKPGSSEVKRGNSLIDNNLTKILSKASHRKSSTASSSKDQNDYLVTFFNLIKLLRQIKELDHTKLLNINKKSSIFFSPYNLPPPVLSMNINNRKSLMNKMNYIHKLTTDLNHRT